MPALFGSRSHRGRQASAPPPAGADAPPGRAPVVVVDPAGSTVRLVPSEAAGSSGAMRPRLGVPQQRQAAIDRYQVANQVLAEAVEHQREVDRKAENARRRLLFTEEAYQQARNEARRYDIESRQHRREVLAAEHELRAALDWVIRLQEFGRIRESLELPAAESATLGTSTLSATPTLPAAPTRSVP